MNAQAIPLSSLIVQSEIATMRQVEEALARQVLYGGDFVTNLFEVAAVDEGKLTRAAAEAHGLQPAPIGVLPSPERRARAMIPAELASHRSIYPLSVSADGDELVVVVAEPLPAPEEEQLTFALGVPIVQRIAPLVRIRQALNREFRAPIERRLERLLSRLHGDRGVASSDLPPLLRDVPLHEQPPSPPTVPPYRTGTGSNPPLPDLDAFPPAPPLPVFSASQGGQGGRRDSVSPDPTTPRIVRDSRDSRHEHHEREPRDSRASSPPAPEGWSSERHLRQSVAPGDIQSRMEVAPPPFASVAHPSGSSSGAPPGYSPATSGGASGGASERLATLVREASVISRPVRRRRGPLTFDAASAELETVADRDQLMDLFFDFARQYFDYSALFIVHTDLAEGREAYGPGASRDRVAGIGVPLDMPSMFASARDIRAPIVAKPDRSGLDGVLLKDLERVPPNPDAESHTIMCVPLVVRSRVVAILYGDAGDLDIDRDAVSDVPTFGLLAGQTLERMILKRKLGGFSGGAAPGAASGRLTDSSLVSAKKNMRNPTARERAMRAEALGRALFSGAATITASTSTPPPSAPRPTPSEPQMADFDVSTSSAAPASEPTLFTSEPARVRAPDLAHPDEPARETRDATELRADDETRERREGEYAGETREGEYAGEEIRTRDAVEHAPVEIREAAEAPERISYSESGWNTPADLESVHAAEPQQQDASDEARDQEEEIFSDAPTDEETVYTIDEGTEEEEPQREPLISEIVLPPRTPPTPHADGEALPSVIVDVSRELELLVEGYLEHGEDDFAEGELLREGHQAMPVLMARFPGPIVAEPKSGEGVIPSASACGPVLRLIAMQRRVALPWVMEHVDSRNEEKRYWATFLLRELAYVDAIPRLVPRLLDVSDRVRRAARWATAGMARQHGEETARELGRVVRDPTIDGKKRLTILEVLEEIREPLAVPTFIAVLNDDSEDLAVAARRALLVVARQDFARDTRRWTQWWNANSSRERIEWLIDALVHESQSIRRAAGEELKAITKEYFGYYDDLPKRDRDRAQARYHEWWITEGRARFTRPS